MNHLAKTLTFVIAVTALAVGVMPAAAQIGGGQVSVVGLPGGSDLPGVISNIITVFLALIGIIAAVFIVIGGVQYMMAQGDEGEISKAKRTVLYAVIGLIVVGLAAVIVNFTLTAF